MFGTAISTIGAPAYTSGAVAQRIYEVTTPYVAADVPNIQYAQSADTLYMVNQNYAPQKLIRYAHANWTFGTFVRTGTDPFTSTGNYPRCVSFDSAARLWYGGTINNPQTIWGSSSPSSGNTAFDDFTFGTASTNAVQFTLAPLFAGKVDYLEWMSNTNQFMVLGTFASMRTMWGAAQGSPVTPTAVTLQPANVIGCAYTLPVANGDTLFFVQRGGQRIRSLEYDFYISGFTTKDQVLASDHLTIPGIQTIRQARGIPDVMWTTRIDGRFLGFTYSRPEIENYACWHRHYLGGRSLNSTSITVPFGFVSSIGVIARNNTADQIWFAVNRTINGNQVCSIEYLSDYQSYPNAHDFYTGDTINDSIRYNNALYETQKAAVYLDMANLYDGSSLGYNAAVSVTPSAASGTAVTLASSAPIFTAAMVGQEIRKQYDLNGNGGGRFLITGFSNNQHVTGNITVDFDNTHAIGPGAWYLTATTLSGLNYLEGETVSVMVDGGPALDATVTNGRITLQSPAATAVVGYPYTGTLETLNIDSGGKLGTAQAKPRNLIRSAIRFLNSGGVQFGTGYYKLKQLAFRPANFQSDRPVALFTGIKMVQYQDEWSNQNTDPQKKVVVIQNLPLPCTVLGIDNFLQTTDE